MKNTPHIFRCGVRPVEGQTVRVGTFSVGRVVWVGAVGGDWDGYCSVRWNDGGKSLERWSA